ncbi:MAG: hypothetical protein ACK49R_19415 [Planctomycetota bacterium]
MPKNGGSLIDPVLEIGTRVTALPVVHGSGDFAWEVRRLMGQHEFDCLAVSLPAEFQPAVEQGILALPRVSSVVVREEQAASALWTPGRESSEARMPEMSYVPIDPCQPVIAALRTAMGERLPRRFIDLPTTRFVPHTRLMPDAFALKFVSIPQYASAVLPFLRAPRSRQWRARVNYLAWQLRELAVDYERILFVCGISEWPWVREAFLSPELRRSEPELGSEPQLTEVDAETLYFMLGELPFVTELYERARAELGDDRLLAIDGVKQLLLVARERYLRDQGKRARRITPKLLAQCLQYVRNLTLIERGFTPQLATVALAAKQMVGDAFAIRVLEVAKEYAPGVLTGEDLPDVEFGLDRALLSGEPVRAKSRLPGPPLQWMRLELEPKPNERQREEWSHRWNPYSQCSWPPEDVQIENFRQAVFDRAREAMGVDLVKTEKFTTSIRDGIDIRDTLRNWYAGEIYVKVVPPNRGKLDCAVMLFDSPADPREYPWRATWFAEHQEESTLCFYATNGIENPIGPGICQAVYGGAMFFFPAIPIPDIWSDPRLDFAETLEERMLAAACLHSRCSQIALLSAGPPGPGWRRLAKRYRKSWIHLPLSRFSDSTVSQLRHFHVLNGRQVRTYAADFIRKG